MSLAHPRTVDPVIAASFGPQVEVLYSSREACADRLLQRSTPLGFMSASTIVSLAVVALLLLTRLAKGKPRAVRISSACGGGGDGSCGSGDASEHASCRHPPA